jgi:acyl transferase domain-containing protein/acyl carrier protein/SAM-dependent methyltransferase
MAGKKSHLGNNPLGWIKSTTDQNQKDLLEKGVLNGPAAPPIQVPGPVEGPEGFPDPQPPVTLRVEEPLFLKPEPQMELTVPSAKRIEILKMLKDDQLTLEESLKQIEKTTNGKKNGRGTDLTAQPEGPERIFYRGDWEQEDLTQPPLEVDQLKNILIFDTNDDLFNLIREKQTKVDLQPVLVKPGTGFAETGPRSYEINPAHEEDYQQLISTLKTREINPGRIVHLWSKDHFTGTAESIKMQLERGIYSVFYLSRALMEGKPNDKVQLLFIYPVEKGEIQPQYAAVSGFARTIRLENPKFIYQTVEIRTSQAAESFPASRVLDLMLQEFQNGATHKVEIHYENGCRFVKRFREFQPELKAAQSLSLKENGVYLITGGMGGLGLIVAEYLAKQYRAKLVLTGRSELDAVKEEKIRQLERLGSEVIYLKADISKRSDVDELIKKTKSHFQKIDGVVHSAGVIRDSFILKKKKAEIDSVLAPKVYGTVYLAEALQEEKFDFLVLFSSLAAVMGNIGQSDYAYGNSFMDHFAKLWESRGSGRILSINWPLWREGGMKLNEESIRQMGKMMGLYPIDSITGINALITGLKSSVSNLILIEGEKERIKQIWETDSPEEVTVQDGEFALGEKETLLLKEKTEAFLKNLLSKELKLSVSKISSEEPLEKYGIDSVVVMDLTRELEAHFGELSKTLFFEYKTITELASYFMENHRGKIIEKTGGFPQSGTGKNTMKPKEKAMGPDHLDRSRFMKTTGFRSRDEAREEEVAIIGLSGRFPMAGNVEEFWDNLKAGKDCITEIPLERWDYRPYYDPEKNKPGKSYSKWGGFMKDVDKFDPLFFNISPREAKSMDPQERLFLETVWETVEDAGYTKRQLEKVKVGVFVGVMYGQYQLLGREKPSHESEFLPSSSFASIANRVSYFFNFRGPSIALDTMCSSSLTAIHLACASIQKGEADLAVASGVNISVHPGKYLLLSQANFASSDGRCRSFGEGGDGYVPGEGVGAVFLKPLSKALADGDHIYAVIKGSSVNHGGKTNGYTVPNPNAQADVIAETLKKTNLNPRRIGYIEAHGTGTSLGDPIEITGLMKAFREYTTEKQFCPIGSVKSNIGHLESAAGIAGIAKVLLQLKYKQLVPSIHAEKLNPNINFNDSPFYVQRDLSVWKETVIYENGEEKKYPRLAGISSFGAGGANAHILLEEYINPSSRAEIPTEGPRVILLSAKNEARLKIYAQKILDFLRRECAPDPVENSGLNNQNRLQKLETDLLKILSEVINVAENEIAPDEDLKEYGVDPNGFAELANQLNHKYQLQINPVLLSAQSSVRSVSESLYREHQESFTRYYQDGPAEKVEKASLSLADLAYTLQVGREAMEARLAILAGNAVELIDKLKGFLNSEAIPEEVFFGNLNQKSGKSNLFDGDEDAREIIDRWLQKGKLAKLAEAWVSGVAIDWSLLSQNHGCQRVSLPTYPFAGERYWISKPSKAVLPENHYLHPLIDKLNPGLSLSHQGIVFEKSLRDTELIVKDHQVLNNPLLPGVGYLEMAYAAALQINNRAGYNFSKVLWLKPLSIQNGQADILIVIKEENGHLQYEIQSKDGSSTITHAKGGIHQTGASSSKSYQRLPIEEIKAGCPQLVNQETFYHRFNEIGIGYGSYFQGLTQIWGNDREALGRLILPPEYEGELSDYTLHPTLLDGALQTIAGLISDSNGQPHRLMLPFAVEKVEILHPLKASGYAYVKTAGKDRFQIAIVDDTGLVCIKFYDLAVKELKKPRESFYYVPGWKRVPFSGRPINPVGMANDRTADGQVLIIHPPQSFGIKNFLAESHPREEVITIRLGTKTKQHSKCGFEIKTEDPRAIDNLIGQFKRIDTIYFLGGIQELKIDLDNLDDLDLSQERGVISLFRLVKSLRRNGYAAHSLRIKVITNNVCRIFPDERIQPYGGSLPGFIKSMAKEYSKWTVSCIDISLQSIKTQPSKEELQVILKPALEGLSTPEIREVAVRNGKCYVQTLKPVVLPQVTSNPFKVQGVYLILGGRGGIGLELSRYLAETVQARLILVGRSQLSREDHEKITAIESKGGKILYLQADASDLHSMEEAVKKAKSCFGKINGVIHSAIVLKDKTLENMDEETLRSVLAPKVRGSVILHQALRHEELDFMMFFSSAQSFSGNAGQSNYAAACTFKDAWAQYLGQTELYPVKIINWGYWGGVGVVATEEYNKRLAAQGIRSITPEEGMETIRRVLGNRLPQVMPLKAEERLLENLGIDLNNIISLYPEEAPSLIKTAIVTEKQPAIEPDRWLRLSRAFGELEKFAGHLLLGAFQKMGVFKGGGEGYRADELQLKLGIIPKYHRLFEVLLDVLVKAGFIQVRDHEVITTKALDHSTLRHELQDYQNFRDELRSAFPEITPHLNLLSICLEQYPEILKGGVSATDIMFPGSSMELLEDVYQGNTTADYYNGLVVRSLQSYIMARLPRLGAGDQIKILEVGAGTGGTSAAVFEGIRDHQDRLRYIYSDISVGFTNYGKKQYGEDNPFVEFKILNIENDVKGQGYQPGDFDVVIATNVLHATRDIRRTLGNIKTLLKTNGWIIINEATAVNDFVSLTFGLLEGWWLYEDAENRLKGAPLLSAGMWEEILNEEGFGHVFILGQESKDGKGSGQNVIIAESNGMVMEKRPEATAPVLISKAELPPPQKSSVRPAQSSPTELSSREVSAAKYSDLKPEELRQFIRDKIVENVTGILGVNQKDLNMEKQFSEYGVDSVSGVELINRINDSLGIVLKTTALFDYANVKDLTNYIHQEYQERISGILSSENGAKTADLGGNYGEKVSRSLFQEESNEELDLLDKLANGEMSSAEVYQILEGYHES